MRKRKLNTAMLGQRIPKIRVEK